MSRYDVTVFRPCALSAGQKIRIEGGPIEGDWEVADVSDRKVRLRCPVTGKEIEKPLFHYCIEERKDQEWPRQD